MSEIMSEIMSDPTHGPLHGVRILDLTWVIGGPFASMILADLGAEVIKIESPEGDMARSVPPHTQEGYSPFFFSVNRNKKSVVLNLKTSAGRAAFERLVEVSDVVYNNFSPRAAASLRLHYEDLKGINPRIISSSIFGFHDEPPFDDLPAFDSVIQAMGGVMSITGEENGPPVRVGYQIGDLAGGLYSAIATLAALQQRERTGRGTDANVSLFDSQLSLLTWQAQDYLLTGNIPRAMGTKHPMLVPNQSFRAKDGRDLVVSATGQHFWAAFCKAIGRPELAFDERYADGNGRVANRKELDRTLEEAFLCRDQGEWLEILADARIPASPVLNVAEALNHPVASLRNMLAHTEDPDKPSVRVVGNPVKVGGAKAIFHQPPKLSEHTANVLQELLGYNEEQVVEASG